MTERRTPRADGADLNVSVVLPATREQVWALVGDPINDPRWCPRVLDAVQVVGAGPGAGATYRSRHRPVPGPVSTQLVLIEQWQPPARRRTTSTTADGTLSVEYELEAVDGGCRFTERDTFALARTRRPLRAVFLMVKRRRVRQQFDCLRELLTGGPVSP